VRGLGFGFLFGFSLGWGSGLGGKACFLEEWVGGGGEVCSWGGCWVFLGGLVRTEGGVL